MDKVKPKVFSQDQSVNILVEVTVLIF